MKTIHGGERVRRGYYWNLKAWEITTVEDGGTLPGGKEEKFVHVPLPVLFVVAPAMGGLFAVFLPFIGFAMTFHGAGKKVAEALARRGAKVAQG